MDYRIRVEGSLHLSLIREEGNLPQRWVSGPLNISFPLIQRKPIHHGQLGKRRV